MFLLVLILIGNQNQLRQWNVETMMQEAIHLYMQFETACVLREQVLLVLQIS